MLKINEIFHSIQGESTRAGLPCVFVRLMACDLRCTYCDTEYAFTEGRPMGREEILAKVRSYRCPLVEITGGEPLLQEEVHLLMEDLLAEGYQVLLETGGHQPTDRVPGGVGVILDIKTPGSGEVDHVCWENLERLKPGDEVKFVLCGREDYLWARKIVERHDLAEKVPVLFSPSWEELAPRDLAAWILEDSLPVRMQVQLHKVIWDPQTRGV